MGNERKGRGDMHSIYIFVGAYCIREIIFERHGVLARRESLVAENRGTGWREGLGVANYLIKSNQSIKSIKSIKPESLAIYRSNAYLFSKSFLYYKGCVGPTLPNAMWRSTATSVCLG